MPASNTLLMYFTHAGPIVKFVMLLLLTASVISWTIIFQRGMLISRARRALNEFEERFWSGTDLNKLYNDCSSKPKSNSGLESIFISGFKEFLRLRRQPGTQPVGMMEGAARAMRIAHARAMDAIEQHLPMLATIGSISPYVGLFGTVWGIMTSFQSLATSPQQATIAAVAPGISEALIATAMGLFAAIPAVIAYNRYSTQVDRLQNQYDTFQEELSAILHRQIHNNPHPARNAELV